MMLQNMSNSGKLLIMLAALSASLIIFVSALKTDHAMDTPNLRSDVLTKYSEPLSGFYLVDHNENEVSAERFLGYWTFVFFGFTNCPDVCPATLFQLARVNKMISEKKDIARVTQIFFVSVDPARDSTQHLAEYVRYFDPGFIGVTGDKKNILAFEKKFSAFHKLGYKSDDENYNVAHTASIFLVNPDGRYIASFEPPMDVPQVVEQFGMLVERYVNL